MRIILLMIFCFIAGYIACWISNCCKSRFTADSENIIRDTIVKSILQEPIVIERIKAKVIKVKDTLILTQPFIARIDTIMRHDTVKVEYQFPEHFFSLDIRKNPDTLLTEYITITRYVEKEQPWWEKPAIIAGSAALGYLAGRIAK